MLCISAHIKNISCGFKFLLHTFKLLLLCEGTSYSIFGTSSNLGFLLQSLLNKLHDVIVSK